MSNRTSSLILIVEGLSSKIMATLSKISRKIYRNFRRIRRAADIQASGDEQVLETVRFDSIDDQAKHAPAVRVSNLCYRGLSGISLNFEEAKCTAILGPKGSGKTALFEVICGLGSPSKGKVRIFGKSPRLQWSSLGSDVGVCPEKDLFFEDLSGAENLEFVGRMRNFTGRLLNSYVSAAFEDLKIPAHFAKFPLKEWPPFERKKLSVAMATLGNPKLIIVDNPTRRMTVRQSMEIWTVIDGIRKQGQSTILIFSDSYFEAAKLCDNVALLRSGKLEAFGTLEQLFNYHNGMYQLFITSPIMFDEGISELVSLF